MEEASKPDEKKPETQDSSEEVKDENMEEPQSEPEPQPDETQDQSEEKSEQTEDEPSAEEKPEKIEVTEEPSAEDQPEEIVEKKPVADEKSETPPEQKSEAKPEKKPEEKKEKPKEKTDHKDDFKYIVRIANTDVDGEKKVVHALTSIKGIGIHMAVLVADAAGINRNIVIGDLSDSQIDKIKEVIENVDKNAPNWMLNHRKDYETGDDIHLIGSDIDMRHRDEINILKKIRCYRGIRHESGLPVRGQRTRANNRKGLSLGVSKKREQSGK